MTLDCPEKRAAAALPYQTSEMTKLVVEIVVGRCGWELGMLKARGRSLGTCSGPRGDGSASPLSVDQIRTEYRVPPHCSPMNDCWIQNCFTLIRYFLYKGIWNFSRCLRCTALLISHRFYSGQQ